MNKIIVFILFVLSVTAVCFGGTGNKESLTISTYYPAPTGVYLNIKLTPSDIEPSGGALQPGVIYYDNKTDVLRFYNLTNKWVNLTGGASGGYWVFNSSSNVTSNINPGKVIIDGIDGWPGPLQVYGDMVIKNKDGNASLYLDRFGANSTSSPAVVFNTYNINDSWVLGSARASAGKPSNLVLGNLTETSDHHPYVHVTVNALGNVGLRSREGDAFDNSTAKLHIVGREDGTFAKQEVLLLCGSGKVGLEMYSASNNSTSSPVIAGYRSRGSVTNPQAARYGDSTFEIHTLGYNGTDHKSAAKMRLDVNEDFTAASTPGAFQIFTLQDPAAINGSFMQMQKDGSVGINYFPGMKFYVRKSSSAYGGVNATGQWVTSSDERFKKNICGIEDALEKVARVQGIRYDSITEPSSITKKGRHFGFVGQELETILPELVDTDSKGYKSVLYESMTPVLVEAIKDQQKEIELLRKEIEALKARKTQGRRRGAI